MRRLLSNGQYQRCKYCAAALLTACIVSACTIVPVPAQDPIADVERLLDAQHYADALALIADTAPSHPDYAALQERRNAIAKRISSHQTATLRKARALAKQQQWSDALALIDTLITQVPGSDKLFAERDKVLAARHRYIKELSLSLAILRAEAIPEQQSLLADINAVDTGNAVIAAELRRIGQQGDQARAILLDEARYAMQRQRWSQAYEYIRLADLLGADEQSSALKKQVKNTIKSSKVTALAGAIEAGDLIRAQTIADAMQEFGHDEDVRKLHEQLHDQITVTVKSLTDSGQKYYLEGLLDKAIDNWQQALALAPDNDDLEKRLLRARLFKSNYKKFQKTQ